MTTHDTRPSAAIIPLRPAPAAAPTTPETFSFGGQPVHVLTIDGDPWFIAKEVCDVLGLDNPSEAIRPLDDDERNTVRNSDGNRGNPNVNIISESGLYALTMRSNKPEAKAFRKWVTGTVLPAIRKTGSYVRGEEGLDPNAPDYLDRLKDLLIAAQDRKLEAAAATIATFQPKAEAFEVIEHASGSLTVTEAAKALGSNRDKLFAFLEHRRWVTKKKPRQPTAEAIRSGYMDARTSVDHRGTARTSPVVTPKGLAWLADYKAKGSAAA